MPWSAKAQELITSQYAAVGAAGRSLCRRLSSLSNALAGGSRRRQSFERTQERAKLAKLYVDSYRHYCWPVASVDDLKLAPFHLLASERGVHVDKDHGWHLSMLAKLCDAAIRSSRNAASDCRSHRPESEADGVRWWEELTGRGGEGMVVKPLDFLAHGRRGLVQPALKCRGRNI